jgi:hypothetical protein
MTLRSEQGSCVQPPRSAQCPQRVILAPNDRRPVPVTEFAACVSVSRFRPACEGVQEHRALDRSSEGTRNLYEVDAKVICALRAGLRGCWDDAWQPSRRPPNERLPGEGSRNG